MSRVSCRAGTSGRAGKGWCRPGAAPHFGQVEHLAQHAEGTVRLGRLVGQLLHQRGHVRALHVLHLYPAQDRDDAAVDYALIAALRAGLVTLLG